MGDVSEDENGMRRIHDLFATQLWFDKWELRSNQDVHNLVMHITIEEMFDDFNHMLEWLCKLCGFGDFEIKEVVRHHVLSNVYERARAESRLKHPFTLIKYGYNTTDVSECDDNDVEP